MEQVKVGMLQRQWFPEAAAARAKGMLLTMTPIQFFSTAAAAFLFATFLFVFSILRLFRRPRSNTILLTGLTGSGKTVIFYMLRDGSSHGGTLTSMDVNDETFVTNDRRDDPRAKATRFVDVPGHSGLRSKLDGYLAVASGIVFVVDALDFLSSFAAVAEYLHNDILSKAAVSKGRRVPVIILCNKTDKVTAHSKEFIGKQLEKEIEKLRASRTGASSADVMDEVKVGIPGQPFSFTHCRNPVTVAEASALTGELSHLHRFIAEQIVVPHDSGVINIRRRSDLRQFPPKENVVPKGHVRTILHIGQHSRLWAIPVVSMRLANMYLTLAAESFPNAESDEFHLSLSSKLGISHEYISLTPPKGSGRRLLLVTTPLPS